MRSNRHNKGQATTIRLSLIVGFIIASAAIIPWMPAVCGVAPAGERGMVPQLQKSAYFGMSEREVWACALKGDYAEVVSIYLEGERPGEPDVDWDRRRHSRRDACIDSLVSIFDDGAQRALLEMLEARRPGNEIVEALACSESEEIISGLFEVYERRKEDLSLTVGVARSGCLRTDPRAVDTLCRGKPLSFHARKFLINVPSSATVLHSKAQKRLCEYMMRHKKSEYRGHWLRDVECAEIQDFVRQMLNEPDPEIFKEAIPLLFKLPEDEALRYISHFAQSEDRYIRKDVAYAVARLATERAIPIIKQLLRDPDYAVRSSIAEGMVKSFPGVEEIALKLSKDPASYWVREYAAYALVRMGSVHAKEALLALLLIPDDKENRVASFVVDFVKKHPGIFKDRDELRPVVSLLSRSENPFARARAAELVRMYSLKGFESVLERLLEDEHPTPRREAYKALCKANPDRLREIILHQQSPIRLSNRTECR